MVGGVAFQFNESNMHQSPKAKEEKGLHEEY